MRADLIIVGDRFRKDLGSIEELAESIREVGLIQPIIVDADGNLIAGRRRLAACLLLGMDDVPAVVAKDMRDAARRVLAERDENTCRKDMTVTELLAITDVIEAQEKPKARERQREHGGTAPGRNTPGPGSQSVRTRDIVGAAVGMSGYTYQRAKAVKEAAEDEDAPPEVREVAQEALEEMDRTGKIKTAYNKVNRAKKRAMGAAVPEPPREPSVKSRLPHKKADKILPHFLTTLNGIAAGLAGVDFSECVLEPYQIKELDTSIRTILSVRKTLKGAN